MFRLRRFRLLLIAVLLSLLSIYEVTRLKQWNLNDLEGLSSFGFQHKTPQPPTTEPPPPDPAAGVQNLPLKPAEPTPQTSSLTTTSYPPPNKPTNDAAAIVPSTSSPLAPTSSVSLAFEAQQTITGEELLAQRPSFEEEFGARGQARLDLKPRPSNKQRAIWAPQKQRFPIPESQVIKTPEGELQKLPKIQHSFASESSTEKADRVLKQTAIRQAFKHAWAGYKASAWGEDELKPISNSSANPFNGWGATLVDSLDTLWIMGLKEEFEEAVQRTSQINFKTSARKDVPMFETTIRYLGGLISAYDISGAKYSILLDKAVQLADILIGAFDTPNRMPIPYYHWSPSYASQPHRSSTHIVMAELGSMAMEFTRLAQITREHKYYDAIARVTNELQKWQMKTSIPGVWPVKLDASGCKKPELDQLHDLETLEKDLPVAIDAMDEAMDVAKEEATKKKLDNPEARAVDPAQDKPLRKRQLDVPTPESKDTTRGTSQLTDKTVKEPIEAEPEAPNYDDIFDVDCDPQALNFEPHSQTHTYSIGAMADSTYEYFPKMYALLGGNEQYKKMYLDSMEVIRKDFLFRPMIKDPKRNILFPAKHEIHPRERTREKYKTTIYEGTHLGCFIGGMFALGSKIFDIPEDLKYAEKLTDGCVWAYESMSTGIMAEEFTLTPCQDMDYCPWNETRWHELLDPNQKERFEAVEEYNKQQQKMQAELAAAAIPVADESTPIRDPSQKVKRDALPDAASEDVSSPSRTITTSDDTNSPPSAIFTPKVPMAHSLYIQARISEHRLPPSYTAFQSRAYKLRPEALESVFYMYRITGKQSWREKGWTMFQNIEKATRTAVGHAALKDVTSVLGEKDDYMESFWLAETLKYAYLLFSAEDEVSLDEWILNTEAHPVKMPKSRGGLW